MIHGGTKMSDSLNKMRGKEFVRKVLEGERDLRGIALSGGVNLNDCDGYEEMIGYLKANEQNLRSNPIQIDGSKFSYVTATGLFLPYVKAKETYFEGAILRDVNLFCGYLSSINARNANFSGARADVGMAEFRGANLENVCWQGANCWRTDFAEADIRGARELDKAVLLGTANFYRTIVTPHEERLIREAVAANEMFDVRQLA